MWTFTVQEAPLPGWNTQSALSCHVSVCPDSVVYTGVPHPFGAEASVTPCQPSPSGALYRASSVAPADAHLGPEDAVGAGAWTPTPPCDWVDGAAVERRALPDEGPGDTTRAGDALVVDAVGCAEDAWSALEPGLGADGDAPVPALTVAAFGCGAPCSVRSRMGINAAMAAASAARPRRVRRSAREREMSRAAHRPRSAIISATGGAGGGAAAPRQASMICAGLGRAAGSLSKQARISSRSRSSPQATASGAGSWWMTR